MPVRSAKSVERSPRSTLPKKCDDGHTDAGDGRVHARSLRAKGWTRSIVALTAHAMEDDSAECLRAGCDAYASKPIDKLKLIRICREAHDRSKHTGIIAA